MPSPELHGRSSLYLSTALTLCLYDLWTPGSKDVPFCRKASKHASPPPSTKPNALSLFPAVFELRSEGSVLAHTAPVDQVRGQSPFEWSVVLIMQPPFCLDFSSPSVFLPAPFSFSSSSPPPFQNHYVPLGFLLTRATQLHGQRDQGEDSLRTWVQWVRIAGLATWDPLTRMRKISFPPFPSMEAALTSQEAMK